MVVVRPFGPWSQRGPHTGHAGVPDRQVAPFLITPRQLQQAPGPGCHLSGPGRRGLRAGMSPSGNVYLFLPSQGQGRTVRRLRTAEGPPAITLRGTFEPAGWRTHPMASPGELHSDTDLDCILAPGGGVRSVTKAALSEFTLLDLHHPRGYLCACSAWPREHRCVRYNRTCQAFRRGRSHISAGKSLLYPNWL